MLEGLERITELVALYHFIVQFSLTGDVALPSEIKHRNRSMLSLSFPGLDKKYADEIVKLYAKILRYQMKAACNLDMGTLSTFVRNIPKIDDWKGMMQEIDEQNSQCQRYQILVFNAHEKLQAAKASAQRETNNIDMFVSTLSRVEVKKDHEHVRYRLNSEYWGSGQWFFDSEEFTTWKQKPGSVLWLRGPVGVGKSCLTSEVIERTLSRVTDEQVAFFYCSEQHSESQAKSTDIISSILKQLARDAKDDLAPPLDDWCSKSHDNNIRKLKRRENFLDTISGPILSQMECNDLLSQVLISGGQKIIIIDGLDECKDPAALIRYFGEIHSSSKNSRFFFSSRFGVSLDGQFPDAILVEHMNNSADVENYINREIESDRRIEGSGITVAQRVELRALLLRHARGM